MKIALDAVGGDHGPGPCIEGALQAAKELDVDVILVGDETLLTQECARLGCHDPRLSIRHAPQVVEMHESPAAVARKKRDSSIWIATELVKSGEAGAVVSPGNTGASMVASFFVLGLTMLARGRRLLWLVTGFTLGHSVTLTIDSVGGIGDVVYKWKRGSVVVGFGKNFLIPEATLATNGQYYCVASDSNTPIGTGPKSGSP